VNTHAHYDHCFGNAAFRPADIWAHRDCLAELADTAEHQRADVVHDLLAAGDPSAELVATAPVDLPDHLVDDAAALDIGGRAVSLRHLGRGHTGADLVVSVDDVLFAGDLVEEGAPPAMGDAYPLEWPATLTALLSLVVGPVVPGHGAVVDEDFVTAQRDELAELARLLTGRHDLSAGPFDEDTRRLAAARVR
jgi:glyoxylase-like metal-dependent hydrolase (beta-lactamase superfamily II)